MIDAEHADTLHRLAASGDKVRIGFVGPRGTDKTDPLPAELALSLFENIPDVEVTSVFRFEV